jgi:hypothetical protein
MTKIHDPTFGTGFGGNSRGLVRRCGNERQDPRKEAREEAATGTYRHTTPGFKSQVPFHV